MDRRRTSDDFDALPVLGQEGPERLIEILAAPAERSSQHRFLHGADLLERAVAAAVLERRARLEASRADDLERKVDDEVGAVREDASSPVLVGDRESPLGRPEVGIECAHLEETDRAIRAARHDREADVLAERALAMRPRNEPL